MRSILKLFTLFRTLSGIHSIIFFVVNIFVYFQKPISSVAPTSIQHVGIISNVYQTNSIKVQPVEPQTLSSSKNLSPTYKSPSNVQSSLGSQNNILSPSQHRSSPETDKSPKPALPPKPSIKPPPRQTQAVSEEIVPPPLPSTEPPDENTVGSKPDTKQGEFFKIIFLMLGAVAIAAICRIRTFFMGITLLISLVLTNCF